MYLKGASITSIASLSSPSTFPFPIHYEFLHLFLLIVLDEYV